jgi:hypothetical protein
MDIDIYNNDVSARVVEIFSNDVVSCVATCAIANRFEALTDAERSRIKSAFVHDKNKPYIRQGIHGRLTSSVSDRSVYLEYSARTQHKDDWEYIQFAISKLDIED